ncbi:MAG TPA: chromosomal replication initiator protein DnaA [Tepidisphaeraceae bacterium]|nr:chromosomal replication initiator protein DnaA [Tepidisphaeraceae bacterium]
MSCISAHDPQLVRLADAIAQRVGQQRFHVWFNNSTRLDLKHDGLEIAVPNDFISEWIGSHFSKPIQEAAHEVLGAPLTVRFNVMPQLFELAAGNGPAGAIMKDTGSGLLPSAAPGTVAIPGVGRSTGTAAAQAKILRTAGQRTGGPSLGPVGGADRPVSANKAQAVAIQPAHTPVPAPGSGPHRPRLRHSLDTYVVGASNQLAHNAAVYVAEFPGVQYNPLFVHGNCGLGKTHLLQGLCKRFIEHHPTKRWAYMTGEEFTNEYITAMRTNKIDVFRRRMRDLDLLVIDDVHFLSGKKGTQEEFLHTFNAIEAMGRQVVLASDEHPKMIAEFGESLINRFVSGMVVRVDPPNYATRCEILRSMGLRGGINLSEEVVGWIARRVTQSVRELEGALNRIAAHVKLTGRPADVTLAQEALGELDRQMVAPVKPDAIMTAVCTYFGIEGKDLMSGRRQRTISLARSVAMFLVRKTAKLSFPEIGTRMGKRNHSTVISACRRIERAVEKNEPLLWTSSVGDRQEEAAELIQRLEEHSRAAH